MADHTQHACSGYPSSLPSIPWGCVVPRPGHSLRYANLISWHLRNLLLRQRRYTKERLICGSIKKMHIGPRSGFFNCPHIKQSLLYLLHRCWRFPRCYEFKVACWRLCPGLVVPPLRPPKRISTSSTAAANLIRSISVSAT